MPLYEPVFPADHKEKNCKSEKYHIVKENSNKQEEIVYVTNYRIARDKCHHFIRNWSCHSLYYVRFVRLTNADIPAELYPANKRFLYGLHTRILYDAYLPTLFCVIYLHSLVTDIKRHRWLAADQTYPSTLLTTFLWNCGKGYRIF